MKRWPNSRALQALIALGTSLLAAWRVMIWIEPRLFAQAVKEAPHDGLDGLSAFAGSVEIGLAVLGGVSVSLYALQRFLTRDQS